jgi:hypothetical protein
VLWVGIACHLGFKESLGIARLVLIFVICVVPYAVLWFFYMFYYAILNKRPGGGPKPPDSPKGGAA